MQWRLLPASQAAIRGPALWGGIWAKIKPIPDQGRSSLFSSFHPSGLPRSHLEVPVTDRGTHWAEWTRRGWWRALSSCGSSQTLASQPPSTTDRCVWSSSCHACSTLHGWLLPGLYCNSGHHPGYWICSPLLNISFSYCICSNMKRHLLCPRSALSYWIIILPQKEL